MSQTLRTFSGSLVALATPFGPDGQVDYKQLEALVEFQLEHHTDGIVALGTTAETPTLSQEEKDKIAQTVIGKVAGRIPVSYTHLDVYKRQGWSWYRHHAGRQPGGHGPGRSGESPDPRSCLLYTSCPSCGCGKRSWRPFLWVCVWALPRALA